MDELLEAYVEAKRNFYLGGLRLSAVEGGRFCEAAFRILEEATTGKFTPLGKQIDVEKLRDRLANLPSAEYNDSIRLHIPRALRVVYDIRNKRDAAHLADNIDPNLQDSSLVIYSLDWVLAEFVRLYHTVSANEAQGIVESLVTRRAPVVQDFAGFLKVLNPALPAGDYALVLLYQRGKFGATFDDLSSWSKPRMRANLKTTLARLVNDRAFAHFDGSRYFITESGLRDVERRKLYQMPD
ncbi:MAG: hypothetical protein ACRD4P_06225 [Bryobacteraceae bacterium]